VLLPSDLELLSRVDGEHHVLVAYVEGQAVGIARLVRHGDVGEVAFAVADALQGMGIDGMTITEVRGHGRQKGHKETYRGQEYNVDLLPKVKLEMVIPSDRSEEVVTKLSEAARTGKIGDGKIFLSRIDDAVRIRNDERGESAL